MDSEARVSVREVIETAPDAMVLVDHDGRILAANRRVHALFGADDLIGTLVEELLPDRFADAHREHRRRFAAHPRTRPMGEGLDLVARRIDGTEFPIDISLGLLTVDGAQYVSAAIRDISDRREAERLKDEFLSSVSHELRTPLTVILGFAKLLGEQGLPDELRPQLDAIVRNSEEMRTMIDRILDFSRIQGGRVQVELEAQPVEELIVDVLPLVEHDLHAHEFVVDVEPGLQVVVDPRVFPHVIVNLLANAAKFTPPGARVELSATRAGALCRIVVADQGCGIPPTEIDRIFDRFHQVNVSGRSTRTGAGIGLAIVKSYTELMGGTVSVDSAPGEGSRFAVHLRLADRD